VSEDRHSGQPVARDILARLIEGLAYAIAREADYPSRPELRRRLTAIEKASHLLAHELIDLRISALLSDGDAQRESWCFDMARDAQSLAQRIAQWRKRNPSKQGRGKLYPAVASGPNPLEHCALIVSLLPSRPAWLRADTIAPGVVTGRHHRARRVTGRHPRARRGYGQTPSRPAWLRADTIAPGVVTGRHHSLAGKPPDLAGLARVLKVQ
jgi:hypothetical protein